jgi:phage gp36-like protein
MSWITLSADDLLRSLSGPERQALQSAALGAGQSSPLPGILADITQEIRGYLAARPEASLGPAGTIPPSLTTAALSRARFEAFTRLPVTRALLTEDRVEANKQAIALLRDVAAGRFRVESPEGLHPEPGPAVRVIRDPRTTPHPFSGLSAT